MMYDLEELLRIQEIFNDYVEYVELVEYIYGICSYEEVCYSILVFRVNNEFVLEF